MKKMMFNDRFGLTDAVIEKRKTVTRRIVTGKMSQCWLADCKDREFQLIVENNNLNAYTSDKELYYSFGLPYKAGEIVAVAQSYFNAMSPCDWIIHRINKDTKGWRNKMFVRADLMPHQIRILDVRAEQLQEITDEDCLREGVLETHTWDSYDLDNTPIKRHLYGFMGNEYAGTPRQAYALLIDKISGKGTWERNPFVWRIEFELINH